MGTNGDLEATYAFQRNIRKEYEILRTPSPEAQYNFRLRTHTLDFVWNRKPFKVGQNAELKGMIGINGALQENIYRGLILLSDYRAFGGGVFALERLIFDRFELETAGTIRPHHAACLLTQENI